MAVAYDGTLQSSMCSGLGRDASELPLAWRESGADESGVVMELDRSETLCCGESGVFAPELASADAAGDCDRPSETICNLDDSAAGVTATPALVAGRFTLDAACEAP